MSAGAKAKGARQERKARRILEAAGYYVVKSGGSLGMFDLVALGPRDVRLIQVKSNRRPGPVEREAIEQFLCPAYARKEVWVFHDYARTPTIECIR